MAHKLIVDNTFDNKDMEILTEEVNGVRDYFVKGPYMAADLLNKNKRRYPIEEMTQEVDKYIASQIKQNRALGELNHPQSAEVNLERACHLITELKQEKNIWIGKSKVLNSTPSGKILRGLLSEGVKVGMSTRMLGTLEEGYDGSIVRNMKLITVDAVQDPSFGDAFVNGILESKQWILDRDIAKECVFEKFEKDLGNMPQTFIKSEADQYVAKRIKQLLKSL